MVAPYQGKVRIVDRSEETNVMELCHQLHSENGMFSMDDNKVRSMLNRAFDKQGGILAGIGPKGNLEGLMYLLLSSFWYSNDPHWEELFLYVSPEHRKSRNAVELLRFAKWCTDQSDFPLFIGILSDATTERKELLYERQLRVEGSKGRFFVYTKKKKAAQDQIMGSKGSNTTTQNTTTAPSAQAMGAYSNVLNQAQGVAATPYQAYGGEGVAPFNQQQNMGVAGVNQYANAAQPYIQSALSQAQSASQPITQQQIQQYMSPYTQDVVNATQAQFNNQNQQQQQGVVGNAISQGALGGNRSAIAQSELANQQQLAQAPVIAQLQNQGYTTGLNTALSQQQAGMQGANLTANLGVAGQSAGLSGAGAQLGVGTQQQQTQQAIDQYLQGQYAQQQAYPFQTTQWLAGLDTGVGSQMGGTSSGQTTAPAPSLWGQALGAATSGVGLLGATGAFGSTGWMLSDKHAKENIHSVGKTHDGQVIYLFNYKGNPQKHIGLIAQEVEKKHPEAVHQINGLKHVDYEAATEDAVRKRAMGGVVGYASGGSPNGVAPMPWANAPTWIPQFPIAHGAGAPAAHAPAAYQVPQSDLTKQAASVGDLAKTLISGVNGKTISGAEGPTSVGGAPLVGATPYGGSGYQNSTGNFNGMSNEQQDALQDSGQLARGGVAGFADGGEVEQNAGSPYQIQTNGGQHQVINIRTGQIHYTGTASGASNAQATLNSRRFAGGGYVGFADGGSPSFDDRFSAAFPKQSDGVINPDDPVRMPGQKAMDDWRSSYNNPAVAADVTQDNNPVPKARGIAPVTAPAFTGEPANDDSALPPEVALGYSRKSNGVAPDDVRAANETDPSKYDKQSASTSGINLGVDSKLWPSLLSAGFGMLASRSPFLGNAIGEGGQAGIASYNAQTKAERDAQQHAQALELERQKFERPYSEMTAAQKAADARAKEEKIPFGWTKNDDGTVTPNTGGPHDPAYLKSVNQATKEKYVPAGMLTTESGALHPAVQDQSTGRILDGVTLKPPGENDKFAPKGGKDPTVIKHLADGIESGRQPPATTGLYGTGPEVKAELEARGFNLQKAQMEADAAKKQIATLNGPQMVRFVGLAKSVDSTIDEVRNISKELEQSGVPLWNRAKMQAYMQTNGNSPQGQLYTRYVGAVNTLKEEFANLANGGYAPTESAWKLANEQINGDYGVKQLGSALTEVQRLIRYRVQAIPGLKELGPGATNRYTGQQASPETDAHGTPPAETAPAKPTLDEFLSKAHKANPKATREQLTDYFNKKYGAQ